MFMDVSIYVADKVGNSHLKNLNILPLKNSS